MAHTAASLAALSEADFRTGVLIPLLRAMGYRDVEHFHGPDELGKDIIAWKPTDDDTRENVAVVAKVGAINASASQDATTVATQIRQALGSDYTDPVTSEPRRAHRVIAATTGSIREAARKALVAQFSEADRRAIRFWSGTKVLELLDQYLPQTLLGSAADVQAQLASVESFEIESTTTRAGTVFRVHPTAGEPAARVQLRFPETAEGKKAARAARRFHDEGGSLTVPRECIESFDPHDELKALFGPTAPAWIRIEQSLSHLKDIPVVLRATGADAPDLTGLRLRGWRAGATQAVFRTSQPDALQIELTLRRDDSVTLRFETEFAGHAVFRSRQVTQFWGALAAGAGLEIRNEHTNELLLGAATVPGLEPPGEALLELLGALEDVERLAGLTLTLPDELDDDLLDAARSIRDTLATGVTRQQFDTFGYDASREQAKQTLALFTAGKPLPLSLIYPEAEVRILGETFSVGPLVRSFGTLALGAADRERLEASLQSRSETHRVTLRPPEGETGEVVTYARRYLSGDALRQYEADFKGLDEHEVMRQS